MNSEDGLRDQCARVKLQYEALEASGDLAKDQVRAEALKHELTSEVRRWLVTKLAHGLIERTLTEYERTRVPEVLKHASETFRTITNRRYNRIQNTDTRSFRVFTADEQVLDVALLSRDAQEQLYLSVRLGLADTFAKQKSSLPLVMDDVLVNADPERAEELAFTLAHAAQNHQLIFLTCHPHTVKLLKSLIPDCAHLELQRLEFSAVMAPSVSTLNESAMGESVMNSEVRNRVLDALASTTEGLGRSDICSRTELSESDFLKTMNALMGEGLIERVGERRGTRYLLASCFENGF